MVASAAEQEVIVAPNSFDDVTVGDAVEFDISYGSSNEDTVGLILRIYYDSRKLDPDTVFDLARGLKNVNRTLLTGVQGLPDIDDGDSDPDTSSFISIAWAKTNQFQPLWNPAGERLVTVSLFASSGFTADTKINIIGVPAAGSTFTNRSVPIKLKVVRDTVPPVVTAPADVAKEATAAATPVALGTGTATDNIDGTITPTATPTGPFSVGSHTVTWSATDSSGNIGTDTQNVTVNDTTSPTIIAADITKRTTGVTTPVDLSNVSATDLVDGAVTPTTTSNRGPFAVGVHTIVWGATDAHGNASTKTQTITITERPVDNEPPVVTAPANISKETTGVLTPVALGRGTATDNIDGALIPTANPIGPFSVGDHTVTWSATDSSGNTGTDTQTVTITVDTTPPRFTFVPPAITKLLEEDQTEVAIELGNATAEDVVDGTNVVVEIASIVSNSIDLNGNAEVIRTFSAGRHTITWRATDTEGNEAFATQMVVVQAYTPIPTLSEWGIILLSIMLALLSLMGIGRKKPV